MAQAYLEWFAAVAEQLDQRGISIYSVDYQLTRAWAMGMSAQDTATEIERSEPTSNTDYAPTARAPF